MKPDYLMALLPKHRNPSNLLYTHFGHSHPHSLQTASVCFQLQVRNVQQHSVYILCDKSRLFFYKSRLFSTNLGCFSTNLSCFSTNLSCFSTNLGCFSTNHDCFSIISGQHFPLSIEMVCPDLVWFPVLSEKRISLQ